MTEERNTYRFIFPRGILSRRMSGLELAGFVVSHMPTITGLLAHMPTIQREFLSLYNRIVSMEPSVLDEIHQWFTVEYHEHEDDAIVMRSPFPAEELSIEERNATARPIYEDDEARQRHELNKVKQLLGV